MIQLKIKRVRKKSQPLPLPAYQSDSAAGLDLLADIDQPLILEPGQRKLVPTGIAVEIPAGFEAQIRPRSGLAIKKGISIVNAPGTIDADYRGEIQVILINLGSKSVPVKRGDRIAQMILAPVVRAQIIETDELSDTQRAEGGFGSTGAAHE